MKQNGTVIVVGLIMMLVMTLIAISSMNHAAITEKMAHNNRDLLVSFQAAESALKNGENWLQNQLAPPTENTTCTSPPCDVWAADILTTIWNQSASWWSAQSTTISTSMSGVNSQPSYIIEASGFVPYELSPDARSKGQGYYFYRVTAKGTGGTDNAQSLVESIYAVQFN